jgi:peptidoglycan/LPS O-acetylase OafA/YrhL
VTAKTSQTLDSLYDPNANNFNFFRVLFASLVVFSHSYILFFGVGYMDPVSIWLFGGQTDLAATAVEGFFVISGFLVTQSWINSNGLSGYCFKRFLRVFPGYIASIIFCITVILPLSGMPALNYLGCWSFKVWINVISMGVAQGSIFLGGNIFLSNPVVGVFNGSIWTIPHEIRCYLIVAFLGFSGFFQKAFRLAVPIFFIGSLLLYNCLHSDELVLSGLNTSGPARLVTHFLAGVTVYLYRKNIPINRTWLLAAFLATVVACCTACTWILPISGTYLLFYAAINSRLRLQNFGKKIDLSYGIYLYGFPVQQIIIQRYWNQLTPLLLFAVTLPIAALLAFASWKLIELPALELKRFTFARKTASDPSPLVSQSRLAE